jgi:DNA polymerase III sliding clamp (beta) subunit (PCNA family)
MEINRKIFLTTLSQIKAHKNIIVLKDSPIDGCLDILYGPKIADGMPRCINKMTIRLGGSGMDLFDEAPVEKLGRPIPVFLNRVKEVLRDAKSCIFEDGCINDIRAEVEEIDIDHSISTWIVNTYNQYSDIIKNTNNFESVTLRKTDYSHMVSNLAKFVSNDPTRYFMNGICFDFNKGGKDFIHMAATDGRKLCLMKQIASHSDYPEDSEKGQFIVSPAYLHIPNSGFNSAELQFSDRMGQVSISTEDYHFEGIFECIEGQFPNYLRVIPAISQKTQWFTLCAASLRMTIDSVKSLLGRNAIIYLNAENPESMNISVGDGQAVLEIEGTASRPMRLSFSWTHLSACLFDGLALTKFWLDGSNAAIITHEAKAVKGLTLDVTKVFMPIYDDDNHDGDDEFNIPKIKEGN